MTEDPVKHIIPLYFKGSPGRTAVKAPRGLKDRIDQLLQFIQEKTGAKFSRNEFILKSIRFYLSHCMEANSKADLMKRIEQGEKYVVTQKD